jgi:hypothetical protein
VSYLFLKVYFVIVKELIILDYYYIVVVDYLSYLGCRVRLVSVLYYRYILERYVNVIKCNKV